MVSVHKVIEFFCANVTYYILYYNVYDIIYVYNILHYEIHYTGNQSSISANGTTIEIKKGRKTDPNTVKDDSVDPSPFMNAR